MYTDLHYSYCQLSSDVTSDIGDEFVEREVVRRQHKHMLLLYVCVLGVTMLLSAHSDDSDMLWLISSDNFPFRSLVSESHVRNRLWFFAAAFACVTISDFLDYSLYVCLQ